MYAPHYELLRTSRYVPGTGQSVEGEPPVGDRQLGRNLTGAEILKIRDADLEFEAFRWN